MNAKMGLKGHNKAAMRLVLALVALISSANADFDMEFTKSPESITVPRNDEVVFECAVNVPADRLVWKFKSNGATSWNELTPGDGIKINSTRPNATKLLVLLKNESFVGEYMCVAWYGAIALASVPGRLTLAQLIVPSDVKTRHVIAPTNNVIVLHCPIPISSPPALIKFSKLGPGGTIYNVSSQDGVLVIYNSKKSDSGIYGCVATNELSWQMLDIPGKIHLTIKDESTVVSPRFIEPVDLVGDGLTPEGLPEIRGNTGSTVRIHCGLVGNPVPRVTWMKDGGPIPSRARIDNTTQILTIYNLRPDDEDTYRCGVGPVWVGREWKLRLSRSARWRGNAKASEAWEGKSARAQCNRPDGRPRPIIQWMLNAEPLLSDGNVRVENETLFIDKVEKKHAGILQCFVSNELGSDYKAMLFQVIPQEVTSQDYGLSPKGLKMNSNNVGRNNRNKKKQKQKQDLMVAPSKPNVTRFSDESIMVSWRQPLPENALKVEIYKVQYKDVTEPHSQWKTSNEDIPSFITSYSVDGLEAGHQYKFRIAAVYENQDNKVGQVSPAFLLQRGGGIREPPTPSFIDVTTLSTNQLYINWTLPQSDISIAGFIIHYRETVTAGKYLKMVIDDGSARSAIISFLNPDTHYEIKIQSFTPSAPSSFSGIRTGHTMKLAKEPEKPTTTTHRPELESRTPSIYTVAAIAGGSAALLACFMLTFIACRRKKNGHNDEKPSVEDRQAGNGFIGAKLPITITSNPLHAEASDVPVEMSFLHNNNCNSNMDDGQNEHSTPPPRIIKTFNSIHSHSNPSRAFL